MYSSVRRPRFVERGADRVELLLQPADADAEQDAAVRHVVERGDLLGDDDRIVLRQDQDAGGKLYAGGRRGDVGHPDQWIGQQEVALAAGQAAVGCVRIGRLVAARDDGVFHRPRRFKSRGFGRLHQFDRARRIDVAAGVAIAESEFHDGLVPVRDGGTSSSSTE